MKTSSQLHTSIVLTFKNRASYI